MKGFQQILVATDLSPAARGAYVHAAAFARAWDAEVCLFHVHEPDAPAPDLAALEAARDAFLPWGLEPTLVTASGAASKAILAHREANGCDLIVLAKHGVRERDPSLMGTTAERVVHAAEVPVLVVYTEPGRATDGAALPAYRRVAVTTDHSEDSRLGIGAALAVSEPFGSEVTVIHAITVPSVPQAATGGDRAAVPDKAFSAYREAQREHLRETLQAFGAPRLSAHIASDTLVPEAVTAAAAALGADFLCIPTHGKGALRRALFGSVAARVMKLAPLPALILPRVWLRSLA